MIRFHTAAEAEILGAARYYAAIHVELARSFRADIELALSRIEEGPERWPRGRYRTRRYVLGRFPYAVVYVIDERGIGVVAVAHGKRKPWYWKARLKNGF